MSTFEAGGARSMPFSLPTAQKPPDVAEQPDKAGTAIKQLRVKLATVRGKVKAASQQYVEFLKRTVGSVERAGGGAASDQWEV